MKEWMDVSEDSLVKIRRTDENHVELLLENGRVVVFEGLEKFCDDCYKGIPEMFKAAGPMLLDGFDLMDVLSMSGAGRFFYTEGLVPLDSCFSAVDGVSSYINDICHISGANSPKISGMILNMVGNISVSDMIEVKEKISRNFPGITVKVSLNDPDEGDKCRYRVIAV
ncbi:MAG: hypothetical protein K6G24_05040 [Lachnospiraceae bacterium]|nr:hypothetical protein [Lachnospiraceae bacterium]